MIPRQTILVLGAGRSSSSLIQELLNRSESNQWQVMVGDVDLQLAQSKCGGHPRSKAFGIDPNNDAVRDQLIASADLVISMVPAFLHPAIASVAIEAGVPVITPSYVGPEIAALHERAVEQGVLVLNEIGLDPGIDHLSAMQILDRVREEGGEMLAFESYCGGLIAPDSDDNPWHYKFSWNPRNVVLAGQGGSATYLEDGQDRLVPPHRVFQNPRKIEVNGTVFEGYANRDSLAYIEKYGLKGIKTLIRGTLRGEGFCDGWDALVQLGCVRDHVQMTWEAGASWANWLRSFTPASEGGNSLKEAVRAVTGASDEVLSRLEWLGLMDDDHGPERLQGTPAEFIQDLLEAKWRLESDDRDMIVMWHRFQYALNGMKHEIISSLYLEGRDSTFTAMSDTVGWPMALAAEAMLQGRIDRVGVDVPLHRDYYEWLLPGLEAMGVRFEESHRSW
ncbi:MAG: saccharopine dehydrogenase family protein [Flavobacteriales bacterium]